jgi:hypothetical protein
MNPSSSGMGFDLGLDSVSTNGTRGEGLGFGGGGGGGRGVLPVGGVDDGVSGAGVDGSGPKWISGLRPSKSSAKACRIFF